MTAAREPCSLLSSEVGAEPRTPASFHIPAGGSTPPRSRGTRTGRGDTNVRRDDAWRWLALAFIALAQLMIALDATVVNIALPSAQAALRFADADRPWVISAYTLAFGGLLFLGGRIADSIRVGRGRALLIGLVGFAVASALSGSATNLGVLLGAR